MTQSGGNGNKHDANPDDITSYEPAYILPEDREEEDAEHVGWWETKPGQKKGKFNPELPSELNEQEPPTDN